MKTKELIKILQEEDPTGESHIRINDEEVILSAEVKDGYWDGPYTYLKKSEDGKMVWVQSTKGKKIDLRVMDFFDFVDRYKGDWEEIQKHIEIEYDYCSDENENKFLDYAKETCNEYNRLIKNMKK